VEGSPEFVSRVQADLEMLRSSPNGQQMLRAQDDFSGGWFGTGIGGSSLTITETTDENGYAIPGDDRGIKYNPAFNLGGSTGDHHSPPAVVLYHELAHTYDFANDSWVDGTHQGPDNVGVNNGEREAVGLPIDRDGDGDLDDPKDFEEHPYELTENGLLEEFGWKTRPRY
ncbi:MAG: type III secretion system effector protein, partial [Micromonosporaceae bacterium]